MSIEKRLIGVNPVASGGEGAEGVSFVESDKLEATISWGSASSTFTYSGWHYFTNQSAFEAIEVKPSSGSYKVLKIYESNTGYLFFYASDSSDGDVAATNGWKVPLNTWCHVLISVSGSTQKCYINDKDVTSEGYYASSWYRYQHPIQFNRAGVTKVAAGTYGQRNHAVFLSTTYYDIDTESNRRMFITSDLKPADPSEAPSAPVNLLLTDADTAGDNAGTGGDFTVSGVLDTAERGPNQWNCSASEFDGSAYLYNTSPSNTPSSCQTITISYMLTGRTSGYILDFNNGSNWMLYWERPRQIKSNTQGGAWMWNADASSLLFNDKSNHVTVSFDLSDSSKRHIIVNGVDVTDDVTWHNYADETIPFADFSNLRIGNRRIGTGPLNDGAGLGEFYMDAAYYDLASDNPFWDSDANRPKPVAQVIDETGTTPWMALPLRADDAGNNLGDGGDFTVSGTLTGARGGSEFQKAGSVNTNNSNSNYLTRGAVSASDTDKITLVCSVYPDSTASDDLIFGWGGYDALYVNNTSGTLAFNFRGYSATALTNALNIDEWNTIMISVDCSTSSANVFINGVEKTMSSEWFGSDFGWDSSTYNIIGKSWDGYIGQMYVDSSYIDFSQETNRHLFIDQLGYWKDVAKAIEAGDIDDPLIFLQFNDWDDMGANSGTGGDFTINGSFDFGPVVGT